MLITLNPKQYGSEVNYCRTKCKNVKHTGFFFKLKQLFSYLSTMARLLVFLEFWFSLKFSVSSLNVLLNYFQILRYHALRSSDQEMFCKKDAMWNFVIFKRKYLREGPFKINLQVVATLKKIVQHRCDSVSLRNLWNTFSIQHRVTAFVHSCFCWKSN